ncbi:MULTISPECIES: peptidoglycan DD-metalloendopeptidase family protein [unclassified Pseudoalteromonas]|uniref:peptidoglycan DD-metalloendopeptidase family protein n=1 Tax=unclassified Pseudoalteromonas TaxID=194690 RepID=UPI00235A2F76|nr:MULTISPECIES: peptidoglycan DD-metalloendopeptidase family protein [unclassified Pseudoalteromonas]MDC9563847.1 peptidoglycan DD-metalloendopeptidase family protein [Pseudoalteromonas sp. GAB2316C]MDC9568351.1 peptidoglycan DD-metalloendopeptidase family protein [Pseudoalteromonas sp. GABNB9D]MDC9572649.1 peptidoglycan DD-metalloendopeptidase family protein [Pseudoalteromonas sp. GABNS16A]MDC9576799.1 peptidoglycan DD-metalloendopeptidase family protein [Pseudoalteromonas sp. GABNS16E]MDC95
MKSQYALYVIVFIVVLLSGCSSRHNPAPVSSLNTSVNDFQKGININGNKYTVQKGDTLYSIAFSAGKDFRTLAKNNSIPSPYIIYPGQIILLVKPGNTMAIANTVKNKKNSRTKIKQKTNKKLKKNLEQPKQREYVQKQANKIVSNAKSSSSSKVKWFWPAKGKVTKRFSNKENGYKGLQIANRTGASVLAAAQGTVVYAGNALRGYGNLIILKHNDDYLSAYAHNSKLLVREKQKVKAGQKIAEMGKSESSVTALRFEIRYRGQAVSPAKYLP